MKYLLDTNILSALGWADPRLLARLAAVSSESVCVSVVSVDEMLTGWHSMLRRTKDDEARAVIYSRFASTVQLAGQFNILGLNMAAMARFRWLVGLKLNVGPNDLRIAATALEYDLTVVTRNLRDFERVPGLQVENWVD